MHTSRSLLVTGAAVILGLFGLVALADSVNSPASRPGAGKPSATDSALLKRGEYLVHGVGLCTDCHSPRNPDGSPIEGRQLSGAPIPLTPSVPMPWANVAPAIAGLPAGWDEAAMVRFLTTGERPNNLPPARPPMPGYRLNQEDAEAVTAYLGSLDKPEL